MISGEDALRIADQVAQEEQWGRVDGEFRATLDRTETAKVWTVHRVPPRLGSDYWFQIDAETGAVLTKGKRGPR